METFKLNGKTYKAKELDFNFLCELSDNGIGIEELDKKLLNAVRVYVAFCAGTSVEEAGEILNQHVINGGQFTDITMVFSEKAENSAFFQALGNAAESQTETPKKTTKKKAEEVTE